MKRQLQLKKETLRTLSLNDLEQVAGGSNYGSDNTCDAPMLMGMVATLLTRQQR